MDEFRVAIDGRTQGTVETSDSDNIDADELLSAATRARDEKIKAAKIGNGIVKWALLRAHAFDMPPDGWKVNVRLCSCECRYKKFKLCCHLLLALQLKKRALPGDDDGDRWLASQQTRQVRPRSTPPPAPAPPVQPAAPVQQVYQPVQALTSTQIQNLHHTQIQNFNVMPATHQPQYTHQPQFQCLPMYPAQYYQPLHPAQYPAPPYRACQYPSSQYVAPEHQTYHHPASQYPSQYHPPQAIAAHQYPTYNHPVSPNISHYYGSHQYSTHHPYRTGSRQYDTHHPDPGQYQVRRVSDHPCLDNSDEESDEVLCTEYFQYDPMSDRDPGGRPRLALPALQMDPRDRAL